MRIGILTGGGDCPGLNAAIRAIVRTCLDGHGSSVVGFHDGWRGLLENSWREMASGSRVDRILSRGGTILGTARVNPDRLTAGLDTIHQNLADNGIDALIPIGGEGTLTAAKWLSDEGVPVVGVPKTIDNDIGGTDYTFGFDTAVSIATDAIDRLHTTAESHRRVMLVEVMGRHAGWIALDAGMATGAHFIAVPERPFDIEEICALISSRFERGDKHVIGVIAEGSAPAAGTMDLRDGGVDEYGHELFTGVAAQMATQIERRTGAEVRTTVLGYVQRGGTPTPFDRILATRLGARAAEAVHRGEFGQMVALRGTEIAMVPLSEAVRELRRVPPARYDEAAAFFG
ncbi:ATP-dependent 6-phosphofructokinase [Tomitella biformata]|uniref:ATP-dependent 6-phosphofructokinase n=1 Tax=Tomitella biformata TaxID=630403 RepID=UPI000465FD4B|nr:ATP-dependent 6-phosphofructokinase [Tomitella biformata]